MMSPLPKSRRGEVVHELRPSEATAGLTVVPGSQVGIPESLFQLLVSSSRNYFVLEANH
jgi:hypothetical protein